MRRPTLIAAAMLAAASVALADPPTPPDHNELKFRPISPGLYVDASDNDSFKWYDESEHECAPTKTTCGITFLRVYSKHGINTGDSRYIFDEHDAAVQERGFAYDGGKLGSLTSNDITLDCVNQTYRLTDTSTEKYAWRAAKSLPALEPVFRYVCAHR